MENGFENSQVLASRWSRLFASILDGLILSVILLPLIYFMGGFDGMLQNPPVEQSFIQELLFGIIGFGLYCAINWKLLAQSGQTIGKKALNIKVVTIDGDKASVYNLVFKRYVFSIFVGYIPVIGGILSIVNILFIFGSQKRALHDHIASTKVVVS
ncbi:RDD family protein [Vibrio alginolyticus]|nr:RDD family protein [Vibrio alginolyticus]